MSRTSRARITVDGIEFDPITQVEVVERIEAVLAKPARKTSYRVVKPYVEFFEGARNDPAVHAALTEADLVVADSVAVQWAASWLAEPRPTFSRFVWSLAVGLRRHKWLSRVIPERGEGASATHQLMIASVQHGWRVGILGGPHNPEATKRNVLDRYPLLQLEGVWSGYYSPAELTPLVHKIKAAQIDILYVAMGFPKQELFMQTHTRPALARVMIGEGGTFDYDEMGGKHRRAPQWMRQSGLEWLWRLILQPTRIFRQLAIPRFMWRIFLQSRRAKKA